jgi:superfamily II DNA or RNA helicase
MFFYNKTVKPKDKNIKVIEQNEIKEKVIGQKVIREKELKEQKEKVSVSDFADIKLTGSYLGQKGYTILKSDLTIKQQTFIKEQLTVKPYVPGSPVQVQKSFAAYRESDKKLYLPRYYGEELFKKASVNKLTEGDDIELTFQGQMRDYQVPVVNKYLEHVSQGGGGLLELYCGWGKSDATLYIIAALKKKAIIIVHKEFLMNQWIERINKYFPNAKIGKIQGQIIDIDGKDIVLCMLQSLSMKDYPASLFDSFGLTIIDEVHHISSEVFSNALFKLVTKYMLGLSATMNRSDGTTKVFKMFLGEVVYKKERDKDEKLIVRGITYKVNDDEYNELELDFRGKPASSKMLSKICAYNRRTEFILTVLKDMILENPKQQIMVIASYRNILNYIFEAVNHRNIGTVGYYVGGMKESALKLTESKQIVLATFSMASEGLDIKSLSTLFMVTPMTKIEQAVGRILRQKHDFNPVVVDIIDIHANFQNQWKKRKLFYKKQNYKIIQTTSPTYVPDISQWSTTFEPSSNPSSNPVKNVKEELLIDSDSSEDEVFDDGDGEPVEKVIKKGKCFLTMKK